jgi:hypothetical protein
LLFAGDVFFGAGLSAISFCGNHLDTLMHRGFARLLTARSNQIREYVGDLHDC